MEWPVFDNAGGEGFFDGFLNDFGGMVDGGKFFGTYPDLLTNQGLGIDGRGRFIPTNSSSQCSAVVANWMGVAEGDVNQIFPSLNNFPSSFSQNSNINFIKAS